MTVFSLRLILAEEAFIILRMTKKIIVINIAASSILMIMVWC